MTETFNVPVGARFLLQRGGTLNDAFFRLIILRPEHEMHPVGNVPPQDLRMLEIILPKMSQAQLSQIANSIAKHYTYLEYEERSRGSTRIKPVFVTVGNRILKLHTAQDIRELAFTFLVMASETTDGDWVTKEMATALLQHLRSRVNPDIRIPTDQLISGLTKLSLDEFRALKMLIENL